MMKLRSNLLTALLLLLFIPVLYASGGMEEVKKGNEFYKNSSFQEALGLYEEAAVSDPESPIVFFNKGLVYYRLEDYVKAREAFQEAAYKTDDLGFEARANYSLGNTAFMQASRLTDSDLEEAVKLFRESIGFYKRALDLDPKTEDAAHNIEVTRLIVKDLLDKLKEQQQQQQENQDKIKEIVEKLARLVEKEEQQIEHSTALKSELDSKGVTATMRSTAASLKREQQHIRSETGGVIADLEALEASQNQGAAPQGSPAPAQQGGPVAEAKQFVRASVNYQQLAENKLVSLLLGEAVEGEVGARDELVKAIEALTQNQDQDQNQDQQQQEQQEQNEQKQNEDQEKKEQQAASAQDILDEEKDKRDEREQQQAAGYYAPLKDW